MTTFDQDDNWATNVFGETEAAKMRQLAKDIQAELQEAMTVKGEQIVTASLQFERDQLGPFLDWLHGQWLPLHQADPQGLLCRWLRTIGCDLCMAYLSDPLWDYDESLSEYAVTFGAADMFGSHDEDDREAGEDDDDDDA